MSDVTATPSTSIAVDFALRMASACLSGGNDVLSFAFVERNRLAYVIVELTPVTGGGPAITCLVWGGVYGQCSVPNGTDNNIFHGTMLDGHPLVERIA